MNRRRAIAMGGSVSAAMLLGVLPTTVSAEGPPKIYVDTLRLLDENGPEKPVFTQPLVALLKQRGYAVLTPTAGAPSDSDAFRVSKLVLVKSTMHPANLGSHGSADMEVRAVLITPTKAEQSLGSFTTHVEFEKGEFLKNDLSPKALPRVLTEVFLPLVDSIQKLTP